MRNILGVHKKEHEEVAEQFAESVTEETSEEDKEKQLAEMISGVRHGRPTSMKRYKRLRRAIVNGGNVKAVL